MLGEAAGKAVASSPRVGSEEFTAALKRFAREQKSRNAAQKAATMRALGKLLRQCVAYATAFSAL